MNASTSNAPSKFIEFHDIFDKAEIIPLIEQEIDEGTKRARAVKELLSKMDTIYERRARCISIAKKESYSFSFHTSRKRNDRRRGQAGLCSGQSKKLGIDTDKVCGNR